jgi:hypothetical protein
MKITPKTNKIKNAVNDNQEMVYIKNTSLSVFDEDSTYINCKRMYYAYHQIFPNVITLRNTSYEKAIKWVDSKLKDSIIKKHYRCRTLDKNQKSHYIDVIYLLCDEMLIDIENDGVVAILFSDKSESLAKEIESEIRKLKIRIAHGSKINLLIQGKFGLDLIPIKNKKPKLEVSLNYNDDLEDVHKHLVQSLNTKKKSGLVLLHGIPGTGKSTYIRYLLYMIKKKVIFLPPRIASGLDSPEMTSLLVENPNSIFIIEDAEELIKSREGSHDSKISMLLNLTDGMLGDSLGIQVICTFNTRIINIDKALLRKGRLIASYEFKGLSQSKSIDLLSQLGRTYNPSNYEMTLADIYNNIENENMIGENKQQSIGFKLNQENKKNGSTN